ncbi:hypothetical protein HY251_12935 [bacterium]|nr:hypothetical protein [bacterium]
MGIDEVRERPEPRRVEEPALRDDVRLEGSRARCPYCHDSVSAEGDDWVACRACLARHHEKCWQESGQCATCREKAFLPGTRAAPSTRPSSRSRAGTIVAAALGLLVALAVASSIAWLGARTSRRAEMERAAVMEAERSAAIEHQSRASAERVFEEARKVLDERLVPVESGFGGRSRGEFLDPLNGRWTNDLADLQAALSGRVWGDERPWASIYGAPMRAPSEAWQHVSVGDDLELDKVSDSLVLARGGIKAKSFQRCVVISIGGSVTCEECSGSLVFLGGTFHFPLQRPPRDSVVILKPETPPK